MTRWIVPHSQIARRPHPCACGGAGLLLVEVVANVGIAAHDGPEVARAGRRPSGSISLNVPSVDWRALRSWMSPWTSTATPSWRSMVSMKPARHRWSPASTACPSPPTSVGASRRTGGPSRRRWGKVDVGADRTPQPDREVAQQVVPGQGIGHDVVQGRPEPLEQERVASRSSRSKRAAAVALREAKRCRLEAELLADAGNTDLEHGRGSVGQRGLDDERGAATSACGADAQRPVHGERLDD